ncbi:MAG: lytic transglycosylase domain-containing protein [Desulfitobacterium sp.]|nr:lytic transglycosylase domain-containing protein [Desulfitobacterium sp.]
MKKKGYKDRRGKGKSRFWIGLIVMVILVIAYSFQSGNIIKKILYPYPYRALIEEYGERYNVDPLLVISVIRAESKFLPQSQSHKGALGLMQLMPDTAKWIAETTGDKNYSENLLREPEKNIQYGTWYIASLQKEFEELILVLAAYNGGRGHVNKWIESYQLDLENLKIEDIPFKETKEYVAKVIDNYENYRKLYSKEKTRLQ